jgi:8-oxo-dGTP pyrophosphatase MutT (NUDIX family)
MKEFRQKLVLAGLRFSHRWTRALTLGARVAVFDSENRVLLVQHTYAPGWLFPGGGVEFGETAQRAAIREIGEEAGIHALTDPQLFGLYSNHKNFKGDHLAFFTLYDFRRNALQPTGEIAAAEFFNIDSLPDGTTGGTRRRLLEINGKQKPSADW